jgi:transposase-like protein
MAQAARKVTTKNANEKLAHRRLTVLELAERLGNVAEACRRGGIDRTSFYDWKRRFQLEGLDGLKDLPPIAKSHPMTTPPEVAARIGELALLHPAYGCNRLEAQLALEGRRVSAITVQKILNDKGLGTRHERWLALERTNAEQVIELSAEQAAFLEKLNPCFKERHVESGRPGQLLSADTFMVGTLKGIGRVYLHAVVDTYGSYPSLRSVVNGLESERDFRPLVGVGRRRVPTARSVLGRISRPRGSAWALRCRAFSGSPRARG